MGNRMELNEQDLEEVVGGAFNFYTYKKTGEYLCYVDGIGTYKATSSKSKTQVTKMCAQNNGLSQQELADMAVAKGYLTPYN